MPPGEKCGAAGLTFSERPRRTESGPPSCLHQAQQCYSARISIQSGDSFPQFVAQPQVDEGLCGQAPHVSLGRQFPGQIGVQRDQVATALQVYLKINLFCQVSVICQIVSVPELGSLFEGGKMLWDRLSYILTFCHSVVQSRPG